MMDYLRPTDEVPFYDKTCRVHVGDGRDFLVTVRLSGDSDEVRASGDDILEAIVSRLGDVFPIVTEAYKAVFNYTLCGQAAYTEATVTYEAVVILDGELPIFDDDRLARAHDDVSRFIGCLTLGALLFTQVSMLDRMLDPHKLLVGYQTRYPDGQQG